MTIARVKNTENETLTKTDTHGETKEKETLKKSDVISRLIAMRPQFNVKEFDQSRKSDYLYCVEWGMEKQKMIEAGIYDRYIEELKQL